MEEKEKPKEQKEMKEVKVQIVKESKVKKYLNRLISLLLLVLFIWIVMTIKNGLDETMHIEIKESQKVCGSKEACIIISGFYEEGFANWNIREYWPFFKIMIGTSGFEEGQDVNMVCPVKLKTDTFQHILTKIYFLYSKKNIRYCTVLPA